MDSVRWRHAAADVAWLRTTDDADGGDGDVDDEESTSGLV